MSKIYKLPDDSYIDLSHIIRVSDFNSVGDLGYGSPSFSIDCSLNKDAIKISPNLDKYCDKDRVVYGDWEERFKKDYEKFLTAWREFVDFGGK